MRPTLFLGTEVLASGELTRRHLQRRYIKVHRNVYVGRGTELTARDRAEAAWLWSGRRATLVGHSAAAGIISRAYHLSDEEVCVRDGMRCTTPARTAFDLGRQLTQPLGVSRIDALLNTTGATLCAVQAVAERHPRMRGLPRLRNTLALVDPGAESPQESRLRLLLVRAGFPRPVTQIPVRNDYGRVVRRIDMGWPDAMVGVEYDGEHHFTNADDYAGDIERLEFLASRGWTIVRVSAAQLRYRKAEIVNRVQTARRLHGS